MSTLTQSGQRPGLAVVREVPDDARLAAFADWLKALDDHDWRGGVEATRSLRSMGISVVLCTARPPGDRRPA